MSDSVNDSWVRHLFLLLDVSFVELSDVGSKDAIIIDRIPQFTVVVNVS